MFKIQITLPEKKQNIQLVNKIDFGISVYQVNVKYDIMIRIHTICKAEVCLMRVEETGGGGGEVEPRLPPLSTGSNLS